MKFGSVCSGIEAASVAWNPIGFEAAWLAEIEPFPCALLAHHYPEVPNLGDMTTIAARIASGEVEAPDLFCGGTPCQAFSVAGLRNSLDDARGNLSLVFCEIANAVDDARSVLGQPPAIIFWENVPGVLSTKDNAFGCFLAGLAGEDDPIHCPNGKWSTAGVVVGQKRTVAWRVLDAQYFGVAQRRRRVFVVASARAGFNPAEVLFEFDGVRRDTAPSREAGQGVAKCVAPGTGSRFNYDTFAYSIDQELNGREELAGTLQRKGEGGFEGTVAYRTAGDGAVFEEGDCTAPLTTGTDPCANILAFDTTQVTSVANRSNPKAGDPCHPLAARAHVPAIAVALRGRDGGATAELGDEVGNALRAGSGGGDKAHVLSEMVVRRLTPTECERLMGFPDDYTAVPHRNKPAADGNRYKALGNSWAVPVVRWIGERIKAAA